MSARALNQLPRPARVRWAPAMLPVEVDGEAIESLRESWLVEDRWWTAEPLRRRYWELVGERGTQHGRLPRPALGPLVRAGVLRWL